jgi:MFS family permease
MLPGIQLFMYTNVGEGLGRKKTFLIGVIIMSIGALMQASAYTVSQMIIARVITGSLYLQSLCLISNPTQG